MIKFNDPESASQRGKTKPLTLQQELKVIGIINDLLVTSRHKNSYETSSEDKQLLQNFVNHYQNMCHYVSYTGGLFCTDSPEKVSDPEKLLFPLKF